MKAASGTDIGRVRQLNEDRVLVNPNVAGSLLAIVADGMGGHNAGEVASEMAVREIEHYFHLNPPDIRPELRLEQLKVAVQTANALIYGLAQRDSHMHGMGTTVVGFFADEIDLCVASVGDSRMYRLRHGKLDCLTDDHTYVNELIRSGQLQPEEAHHHPRRNVLTRSVGTDPHVKVDVQLFKLRVNDLFLLCSDGLTHRISETVIYDTLVQPISIEEKVAQLIRQANDAGGEDNISVIIIEVDHSAEGRQ